MLAGLQEFIRRYRGNPDHPSLQDLIETLRPGAASQVEFQQFVDQWFFDVVLPELRIREAAVRRTEAGWNVSATIENVARERWTWRSRRYGAERSSSTSISLAPGLPRQVEWTVPFEPARVVLDPNARVLQRNRKLAEEQLERANTIDRRR